MNAGESEFFGSLFAYRRLDELKRLLCTKIRSGIYSQHYVTDVDVYHIVSELVEEAERGPFERLHLQRNDDGSFRPLCLGCERPLCCIVFETIRLTADELLTLSHRFAMSPDTFFEEHCEYYSDDAQQEFLYKFKRSMPCEFLHNDKCDIYTDRPKRCRYFPLQRDPTGENFAIYPWCSYFFNVLWYEATLRVLEHIMQKYRCDETPIRYGGSLGITASCEAYVRH